MIVSTASSCSFLLIKPVLKSVITGFTTPVRCTVNLLLLETLFEQKMQSVDDILAKSVTYGELSLPDHTKQVASVIEYFAKNFEFDFNPGLAIKGAILHDLGKAHPYFRKKMEKIKASSLIEEREYAYVHRHELSSLAFLPAFPKNEWNILIDMVVAHHKSIINDLKGAEFLI